MDSSKLFINNRILLISLSSQRAADADVQARARIRRHTSDTYSPSFRDHLQS